MLRFIKISQQFSNLVKIKIKPVFLQKYNFINEKKYEKLFIFCRVLIIRINNREFYLIFSR